MLNAEIANHPMNHPIGNWQSPMSSGRLAAGKRPLPASRLAAGLNHGVY